MLYRIDIAETDGEQHIKDIGEAYGTLMGLQDYKTESELDEVEKLFLPEIKHILINALEQQKLYPVALEYEDLTLEESIMENKFFSKVILDYYYSIVSFSTKEMFISKKKKRKDHEYDKSIGSMANIFADKLDRDYLLFFQVGGWYNPTSYVGEKLNALFLQKEIPSGARLTVKSYLVDGNSGKVIAHSDVTIKSRILFKEGKENRSKKILRGICEKSVVRMIKDWKEMNL